MSDTVWSQAKAVLVERGWYQGGFGSAFAPDNVETLSGGQIKALRRTCSVCVAGAINVVLFGDPWEDDFCGEGSPEVHRLWDRIEASGFESKHGTAFDRIGEWNDAADRTLDDVLSLLDELDAAERAS